MPLDTPLVGLNTPWFCGTGNDGCRSPAMPMSGFTTLPPMKPAVYMFPVTGLVAERVTKPARSIAWAARLMNSSAVQLNCVLCPVNQSLVWFMFSLPRNAGSESTPIWLNSR